MKVIGVDYVHSQWNMDWPHSSSHRYVRLGLLPDNWAGDRKLQEMSLD